MLQVNDNAIKSDFDRTCDFRRQLRIYKHLKPQAFPVPTVPTFTTNKRKAEKAVNMYSTIISSHDNENRIGNNDRGEQDDGDYNKFFDMYFRKLGCVASAH